MVEYLKEDHLPRYPVDEILISRHQSNPTILQDVYPPSKNLPSERLPSFRPQAWA